MVIVYVTGNPSTDNFLLIPFDVQVTLGLLNDLREEVEIPRTNEYLFARFLPNTSLSGEHLLEVINSCPGLAFPDHIQSTALKKYTATVMQVP